jgi:hypothetical protein
MGSVNPSFTITIFSLGHAVHVVVVLFDLKVEADSALENGKTA